MAKILRSANKTELTTLELEKLRRKAFSLGDSFRDRSLGIQAKELIDKVIAFRRDKDATATISTIESLCDQGFRLTAEVIYIQFLPSIKTSEPQRIVLLAPTFRACATLLKALPSVKKELEALTFGDPRIISMSAIADWFFQNGKLEKAEALFSFVLHMNNRPIGLPSPEDLLQHAVKRDKKAILLRAVISHFYNDNAALHRFARILLRVPSAAIRYAEVMRSPNFMKFHESGIVALIRALTSAAISEPDQKAEFSRVASLLLIRLISGILILQPENKPQPVCVHKALVALEDLERAADTEKIKAYTWAMHPSKQTSRPSGSALINPEGAKIFKIAFDNVDQSTSALPLLEAMAFNLGMIPLENPGEHVIYDPLQHEDGVGGLLPGDMVEVTRKGWSLDGIPIIRAKVK